MLLPDQIDQFRRTGHLTVTQVFNADEIQAAIDDVAQWSGEVLQSLPEEKRSWYVEQAGDSRTALRKLDNPVFHRPVFRKLANHPALLSIVQQLIGQPVSVFFSQIFMKPPEVGGPKPIHQDNFYFGPDDPDATLTAWIALDDATIENGCLYYHDVHQTEIVEHRAPEGEPYNLQMPTTVAEKFRMLPAPVPRGGVSFHHGNTPHQSSANRSSHPRRAAALHYLNDRARLIKPALDYDPTVSVQVGRC